MNQLESTTNLQTTFTRHYEALTDAVDSLQEAVGNLYDALQNEEDSDSLALRLDDVAAYQLTVANRLTRVMHIEWDMKGAS